MLGKATFEAMRSLSAGGPPLKEEMIEWMGDATLLDHLSRSKREAVRWYAKQVEKDLAKSAGLRPQQVIVYCAVNAPGYQQAAHW